MKNPKLWKSGDLVPTKSSFCSISLSKRCSNFPNPSENYVFSKSAKHASAPAAISLFNSNVFLAITFQVWKLKWSAGQSLDSTMKGAEVRSPYRPAWPRRARSCEPACNNGGRALFASQHGAFILQFHLNLAQYIGRVGHCESYALLQVDYMIQNLCFRGNSGHHFPAHRTVSRIFGARSPGEVHCFA